MQRLSRLALLLAVTSCCGCTDSTTETTETTAAAPAPFNVAGLPTVEISVPDMMCEQSCVPKVRKSLASRAGVKDVQVDLETKTAVVAVDESEFDVDDAIADLLDLGFDGTHVAGVEPVDPAGPALTPPEN